MRILFIIFALLISFNATACFSSQKNLPVSMIVTPGDSLTDERFVWDFGRVKEGGVEEHEFVLKNDTGKTVNITDVKTSCGCTASTIKKTVLKPLDETRITVKFNSKGYKGEIKQYVYVHTDNADNPIIRLIVKAEVVKK